MYACAYKAEYVARKLVQFTFVHSYIHTSTLQHIRNNLRYQKQSRLQQHNRKQKKNQQQAHTKKAKNNGRDKTELQQTSYNSSDTTQPTTTPLH